MSLATITDHVARTLANLPSRFSASARLRALVSILATECQVLEDTLWDLIADRMLSTAAGVQLDAYGELVGQPRLGGFTDDEYRALISVRIQANRTSGEAETVIDIISKLVGVNARYRQKGQANYSMEWEVPVGISAAMVTCINDLWPVITGAGISWSAVEGTTGAFRFDSGPGFDVGKLGRRIDV